jgi:WD40 repeat protein
MKRAIVTLAVLFFGTVFSSCGNTTEESLTATGTDTPTRPVDNTATLTHTPSPTKTRKPTKHEPTYTVTNTPITYSSFDGSLPHLAYWAQNAGGETEIVLFNPETMGRKTLDLPEGVENMQIAGALSPDGEWLAFHTGSAGIVNYYEYPPDIDFSGPLDLTLHLLHLSDMEMITVTKILSSDYPDNFNEIAQYLMDNDPDYSRAEDIEEVKTTIMDIFLQGITAFEWSPNSRYLAFAGEMDGPTSDLYVYDTQTGAIRRLTDGYGQMIGSIRWSPDGKWILHSSTNTPHEMQWTRDVFVARANGSGAKRITESTSSGYWISRNTVLISETSYNRIPYNLRKINVETGYVSILWEALFIEYAMSPVDGSAAVCAYPGYVDESIVFGLYIVRPYRTPQSVFSEVECFNLMYRGSSTHTFLFYSGDFGILGVTKENHIVIFLEERGVPFISPDFQWMVFRKHYSNNDPSALQLFDRDDTPVRDIGAYHPENLFWRDDSRGLFFTVKNRMYYVSIPDGVPVLFEENMVNCYETDHCYLGEFEYKWIP